MFIHVLGRIEDTLVTPVFGDVLEHSPFFISVELLAQWDPTSWFNLLNSTAVAVTIIRPGAKTVDKMWQVSVRIRGKRTQVGVCFCHSIPRYNFLVIFFCYHPSLILSYFSSMSQEIIWNICIVNTYTVPKGFPRISLTKLGRLKVTQDAVSFRQ